MPLLDAATIAAVTGLDATNGGVEKALEMEADAVEQCTSALGSAVYAAVTDEGGESYSAERYATLQRAAARIAFALVAPTMGSMRPTDKGGFQRASGPESARVEFLSPRQISDMVAPMREQALSALSRLRADVEADSETDAIPVTPPLYVC